MISKYNAHFEDAGIRFECPICFQWKSQEKEMLILYCCSQKICIDCEESLVQKLVEDIIKLFSKSDKRSHKSLDELLSNFVCVYCRSRRGKEHLTKSIKLMFLKKINPDTGDFEKMMVHLEKNLLVENADTGKDWAQFELGKKYLGDDNIPEGLKYIQMSAEKGYAPAQFELGLLYQEGNTIGVSPDLEKSFHFFFQSANQGFAKAQVKVARAYLKGQGVDKDVEQYVKWLKKSADLGYDEAQFLLGNSYLLGGDHSYLSGKDGTEDQDKGFEYVLLAANQGHMKAIWLAGCLYSNKDNKCLAIYYCKKYIKQSVTEKFNKDHKETVIEILSQLSSVCGGCHKKGDGFKYCSKCNCIYYCSVECQIKDWKENGHKEQCKKLKELC